MELQKLTRENVDCLRDKHIYLVPYFIDYIEELYTMYPELPLIEGVIDQNPAKQGKKVFRNFEFTVSGMDILQKVPKNSVLVITTGYFREEYEFLKKRASSDLTGNVIYYFANRDTEYYETYLQRYREIPLRNMIVFRSGMGTREYVPGMDFTENARALFEYLLKKEYNRNYELVWLVKYPENYRKTELENENVHFVSYDWAVSENEKERDDYYRAICLAKYFFFTHACGFCRLPREGQIRVQLWHGCGFKTIKNNSPQRAHYEYSTVISRLYAQIHEKDFGLDPKQLLVTGYAKEDWLFHPIPDWKERLHIPETEHYIFWLPTFRTARENISYIDNQKTENQSGLPIISTIEELYRLNKCLLERNATLLVKLHPLQKRENIFNQRLSHIIILENEMFADADLHINQVLGDADALISDYSSVAVDFLLLDRPVAFTLDDLEEYEKSRGFVLNPIREWIPGKKLFTFEDYVGFIQEVLEGRDLGQEQRRKLTKKMHDFHDDRSCQRIVEALGF